MCNLYRLNTGSAEIARLFDVSHEHGANLAEEVYPGYPGLVVAKDHVRMMTWGFPLVLTGKQGQKLKPKAVTNARDDKLATGFWRASFEQRRCLIPVSAWAEPEGEVGGMTRTWHSLPGGEPIAIGGLWRPTAEWGAAYAMVMVDSSPQMGEVHDRMPVILHADDWERWTTAGPAEAFSLCQPWTGILDIDRTEEFWATRSSSVKPAASV